MEPPPAEADEDRLDRALRRVGQVLGLVVLLAELAFVYNEIRDGAPAQRAKAGFGRVRDRLRTEWAYASAPMRARKEAPRLWWEAWRIIEGEPL